MNGRVFSLGNRGVGCARDGFAGVFFEASWFTWYTQGVGALCFSW